MALFVPGSSFDVQAENAPGTFTDTTNLTPGSVVLGSGTLNLTISIVNDGPTGQWLVFDYSTVSGAVFTSPFANWLLGENNLDAAVPVFLTDVFAQWLISGVPQTPTSSIFAGFVPGLNPIPGGAGSGLVATGLSAAFPAGPLPPLPSFIDPWSALDATGIVSSSVNGFLIGLKFQPQFVPPPPSPGGIMSSIIGKRTGA